MIYNLATVIIRDGKFPVDWEQSFIVCLYKGKGDTLDRGKYRGFKLTEPIDNFHFGYAPRRNTTDVIFVVQQLQEKYLAWFIWPLWTWRKHLTMSLGRLSGGPWES